MKEITFNNKPYRIPESWEEITLKMVIDADRLSDLLPESPLIAIIGAYTDIPIEEIKSSDILTINEIVQIMSFINEPYVPVPMNDFVFEGISYGTKPDLTQQEFQDWLSIQTILYNNKEEPVKGLSRILAVYCKRDNETLDDINIDERAKLFERLPFTVVKNVECFFLNNLIAWSSVIQLYSKEQEMEEAILQRFNEVNDIMKQRSRELGWYSPTRWLIGIYRKYLLSIKKQLEKSFNLRRIVS